MRTTIVGIRFIRAFAISLLANIASAYPDLGQLPVTVWISGSAESNGGIPGTITLSVLETVLSSHPGIQGGRDRTTTATGTIARTPWVDLRMEAGRTYSLGISLTNNVLGNDPFVDFKVPTGYRIEFEGEPCERAELSASGEYEIRLVPETGDVAVRAGEASSLSNGRIDWSVGLGSLASGESAGFLRLIDSGAGQEWTEVFTPAALTCATSDASGAATVYLTPTGASAPYVSNAIQQVRSREVGIDVVPSTATSYEIRVYERSKVTDNGPAAHPRFTFANHPFVVYTVAKVTSNHLQITKVTRDPSAGTIIRTSSTSIRRTGVWPSHVWTRDDWHTGPTVLSESVMSMSLVYDNGPSDYSVDQAWQVRDPSQTPAAVAESGSLRFRMYSWGEEVVIDRVGADTTTFTYYTNSNDVDSFTQLSSISHPTGGWEAFEYYGPREVPGVPDTTNFGGYRVHRPYKDTPATIPASLSTNTSGVVSTFHLAAPVPGMPARIARSETKINGILAETTELSYASVTPNGTTVVRSERLIWTSSAGEKLKTVSRNYKDQAGGLPFSGDVPLSIEHPTGEKTVFAYHLGTLSGTTFTKGSGIFGTGGAGRTVVIRGTTDGSGNTSYTSYDGQSLVTTGDSVYDVFYLVPNRSTMDVTIRNDRGQIARTETRIWNGSWQLVQFENFAYTAFGLLASRTSSNGEQYTASFYGDLMRWEISADGSETRFYTGNGSNLDHYDSAGRVTKLTQAGVTGGPPTLVTSFTYDAAGNLRTRSRGVSTPIMLEWTYDLAGRVSSYKVPGQSGISTTNVTYPNGGRDTVVTNPLLQTVTTTRHRDGRVASVTGSGTVATYYAYKVEPDGKQTVRTQADAGSDPDSGYGAGWTKITQDWIGRTVTELRATTVAGVHTGIRNLWNPSTGTLSWTVPINQYQAPTGAYTRYSYDVLGEVTRYGLDVDSDGLEESSSDQVFDVGHGFELRNGSWWYARRTETYPSTGSSTKIPWRSEFSRVSFPTQAGPETTSSESETFDQFNNRTLHRTLVNRTARVQFLRTQVPGSSTLGEVEYRSGLPVRERTTTNVTTLTAYDSWGRVVQRRQATAWPDPANPGSVPSYSDPANLLVHFRYYDGTDLVKETGNWADPSFRTSRLSYDALSRVVAESRDHELGQAITTYSNYDARGFLTHRWGNGTHPIRMEYDVYGRLNKQHTFRGGSGWEVPTLPPAFSTPVETTTWVYDAPSGLLSQKLDAKGRITSFAYDSRNRLYTREWARTITSGANAGQRVKTTYSYYDQAQNQSGALQSITYNDGTPSVSYIYERDGQYASVTDATGTRTFNYGPKRELTGEVLPTPFYPSAYEIGRKYYTGSDGAPAGFLYATSFGAAGNPWGGTNGSQNQTRYSYQSSTGRFNWIRRDYNTVLAQPAQTFTYAYETNGFRTKSITSTRDTSTPETTHKLDFGLQAWRDVVDTVTTYGKNAAGLAIRASYTSNYDWTERRIDETLASGTVASLLAGSNTSILQSWRNGTFHGYNSRSEVTGERVYNVIDEEATEVTAKRRDYQYDNGYNRVSTNVGGASSTSYTYAANDSIPTANEIDSTSGFEASELGWDQDGNLTQDGAWTYTYDAENRLRSAAGSSSGVPHNVSYTYDYLGRRVGKTTLSGAFVFTNKFVFDGWNLVAELNGSTVARTYTWGTDATGSIRSGGARGLLMITVGSSGARLFPAYDGRHNVTGLLDESGAAVAAYSYDSFGRSTGTAGGQAGQCPFGFNTQYTEPDVGLVYFGHRFYSPRLGRFISRDPIGETGGANLYAYANNDPANRFDVLGLLLGDDSGGGVGVDFWFPRKRKGGPRKYVDFHHQFSQMLDRRHGIEEAVGAANNDESWFDRLMQRIEQAQARAAEDAVRDEMLRIMRVIEIQLRILALAEVDPESLPLLQRAQLGWEMAQLALEFAATYQDGDPVLFEDLALDSRLRLPDKFEREIAPIVMAGTRSGMRKARAIGEAGERAVRRMLRIGNQAKKRMGTTWGGRYFDGLKNRIGYEVKSGSFVELSNRILVQLAKDVELVRARTLDGVVWVFHGGQPSQALADALKAANIPWRTIP